LLLSQGKLDEAIEDFDEALRIDANDGKALLGLWMARAKKQASAEDPGEDRGGDEQ